MATLKRRLYRKNSSGTYDTIYLETSADLITGTVAIANGGTGNTTGLAASATKLATARTIRTNLASTSTASFNGTANITPGVTGTLPVGNGGTGATTAADARSNLGITPANIGAAASSHNHSASNITSGTLPVTRGGTGRTSNPSMLVNLASASAASVFAASPRPGVTGTLPVTKGGTGVTSLDELKNALGISGGVKVSYGNKNTYEGLKIFSGSFDFAPFFMIEFMYYASKYQYNMIIKPFKKVFKFNIDGTSNNFTNITGYIYSEDIVTWNSTSVTCENSYSFSGYTAYYLALGA